MITANHNRICPVELSGSLDNAFRKLLQNPGKILKPYIREGMKVLDFGCGPGFFTVELADRVGKSGKVIAADLQQGMLDKVGQKIKGTGREEIICLHKCTDEGIGIHEKVNFILAFYVIHEVPDRNKIFREMISLLNTGGMILIIEPKFHVNKKTFDQMAAEIKDLGLTITGKPKVFFSRSLLLKK